MQRFPVFIFCWCILFSGILQAQDLEDFVGSYTGANGRGYMQPLADAFGANLNSGLFHSAKIDSGFHFYIGFATTTALIADKQKFFTASTEGLFSPETTALAPTIFGPVNSTAVDGNAGTAYNFPGGLDLNILPVAVPQLHIGNILGTEFTLRYIAIELGDNFGKLDLLGWGVRHSISQYFKSLSLDIAVGYFQQNFDIGDVVEARSDFVGLQVGKDVGIITLYGGVGLENSTLDIAYTFDDGEVAETIEFELEGENNIRVTGGFTLNLSVVKLNADINLASQKVFTLGLGFGF